MNIVQAIKDVENVLIDMNNIVAEAIIERKAEIIDLNTSQLEIGLTNEGRELSPEYETEEYATLKKSIGSKSPKGIPDLKFEGDFYSGFDIKKSGDTAWIDSTDEKSASLQAKYDNIFGIMPGNRPEMLGLIAPVIKRKVLNKILK